MHQYYYERMGVIYEKKNTMIKGISKHSFNIAYRASLQPNINNILLRMREIPVTFILLFIRVILWLKSARLLLVKIRQLG